jgi:phosphatidylserine/phosphatidylglycerophosphate/cardiolipin synthase-like enzyme
MKYSKNRKKILIWFLVITSFLVIFSLAIRFLIGSVKIDYFSSKPKKEIYSKEGVVSSLFFSNNGSEQDLNRIIVEEINNSKETLDIAVYSLKSLAIKEAIYRAEKRGVLVTIILDFRKKAIHDEFLVDAPTSIKRLNLGSDVPPKTFLMHHKFAIIDRHTKDGKLIFGSHNWTDLQDDYDQSFLMVTSNKYLVSSFSNEFERLNSSLSGRDKLRLKSYNSYDLNLKTDSGNYQVFFGPSRGDVNIFSETKKSVEEAKKSIKILAWDFTNRNLADYLVIKAEQGVKVYVIGDSFNINNKNSVFNYLKEIKKEKALSNLEVLSDQSKITADKISTSTVEIDPFLHHHALIVDDKTVIFGTNNWSEAGFYSNDESIIKTNDPKIVASFLSLFEYNHRNSLSD